MVPRYRDKMKYSNVPQLKFLFNIPDYNCTPRCLLLLMENKQYVQNLIELLVCKKFLMT